MTAEQYVRKIRNTPKRQYAERYLDHLRNGGDEPSRPIDLSYMGAQAVMFTLLNITAKENQAS